MEIITCHYKENLRWLEDSPYPVHVVGKEGGDTHLLDVSKFKSVSAIPNIGLEASSYLWYIIKNYESLPERMAFIHGHEKSPHQRLPVFTSIEKYGFDAYFVDINRCTNQYMILFPNSAFCLLWDQIMRANFGQAPKIINFRGMAQFVVHKECVMNRPRWLYERLLDDIFKIYQNQFLRNWIGYFFEALWHVIFGLESPLEDKLRTNILQSPNAVRQQNTDRMLVDCSGDVLGDYIDVFTDTSLKVYNGPWEFMQALIQVPDR